MKIGILSDSHGNDRRLRAALELLTERGARTLVHCGDLGNLRGVEILSAAEASVYLVAGNMDGDVAALEAACRRMGVHFAWEVAMVPLGDARCLAATHGGDAGVLGELVLSRQFPYVCHGHTHRLRDERMSGIRVLCPGALARTARPTVMLLDLQADSVEVLDVPDRAAPPKSEGVQAAPHVPAGRKNAR